LLNVGKGVILLKAELMMNKVELKLKKCVRLGLLNQCGQEREN
jgi:hypothetical protein